MIFFIPTLVPTVVACLLWIWVMQPDTGIVNRLLGYIGIQGPGWLSSMFWSKPALILMMVWTCGNAIIIYLAGLQDIPDSLYESAALDGAGFFRQTMSVTIPLLRSTILYNVVTLDHCRVPVVCGAVHNDQRRAGQSDHVLFPVFVSERVLLF